MTLRVLQYFRYQPPTPSPPTSDVLAHPTFSSEVTDWSPFSSLSFKVRLLYTPSPRLRTPLDPAVSRTSLRLCVPVLSPSTSHSFSVRYKYKSIKIGPFGGFLRFVSEIRTVVNIKILKRSPSSNNFLTLPLLPRDPVGLRSSGKSVESYFPSVSRPIYPFLVRVFFTHE